MVKLNNEMLSGYEAPTSKVFVVKIQKGICQSPGSVPGFNGVNVDDDQEEY